MRYILMALIGGVVAFAPAPLPKRDRRAEYEWVVYQTCPVPAAVLANDIPRLLRPGEKIDVMVSTESDTLFLRGPKQIVDRILEAVKERDDAARRGFKFLRL